MRPTPINDMDARLYISDCEWIVCSPGGPFEEVAPFDWIQIRLTRGGREVLLYDDYAIEGVRSLSANLASLMRGELELDVCLQSEGIGQWYSRYSSSLARSSAVLYGENPAERYILWQTSGSVGNQTWMYSLAGEAYLEVTPSYIWAYEDENAPGYVPIDDFLRTYTPVGRFAIAHARLIEWQSACERWLASMERMIEEQRYTSGG